MSGQLEFKRYKLRVYAGWIIGMYDKAHRDKWLAIIARHAALASAEDGIGEGSDPSELSALRRQWVLTLAVVTMVPAASIVGAFILGAGYVSGYGWAFIAAAFCMPILWITQFPTRRTVARRRHLGRAVLEVSQSILDASERRKRT